MKNIPRNLIISLVPFLAPLASYAQSVNTAEQISRSSGSKNNVDSWRASQVMGVTVKNSSDEIIGEVKDIALDMKSGEIIAVIISTGGFLGMADTMSAVPISALWYDQTAKAYKTKLTKEQLSKAPNFKNDTWPNYSDVVSYQALRNFRDLIGGDVTQPDNSAQNEKEMEKNAKTPTDQGNSDKDLQITKDIRSDIMSKDLSFNAKNIKIITSHEQVTLKGVVDSEEEHKAVLAIAKKHCDAVKIVDEMKVKSN
jgi:osmotically-inducible protein OsmY/sporulation protein YlmC with PRC-barrel domain